MRAAPNPRTLTGWFGASPHVLRFPPAGFPPVSRLPAGSLPFVRLSLVSLRPAFSGLFPSAVARVPVPLRFPPGSLPLSNLHVSAAVRRFRRRWSRAAGTKVTSPAATTSPGSRDRAPCRWARWDVATESPVTSGRERKTSPRPNRPDRRLSCSLAWSLTSAPSISRIGPGSPRIVATEASALRAASRCCRFGKSRSSSFDCYQMANCSLPPGTWRDAACWNRSSGSMTGWTP
jgi:hypothetical protein